MKILATNGANGAPQSHSTAHTLTRASFRRTERHFNGYPTRQPRRYGAAKFRLSTVKRSKLNQLSSPMPSKRAAISQRMTRILELHGYPKGRRQVGSLVIPLWNWQGERAGVAIRLTIPRTDKTGKKSNTTFPTKRPTLDVSPATRHLLEDLEIPVITTEGAKRPIPPRLTASRD
jgi:hypothetical protein